MERKKERKKGGGADSSLALKPLTYVSVFHETDLTISHFIIAFLLCFQVNEKLGHSAAMDNTSVDVMTHKKKKKHKKEKEIEEEPIVLASAQCSSDSDQVSH